MSPIVLGIIFIIFTVLIILFFAVIYSKSTEPSNTGLPPKIVGLNAPCNTTNLLCDVTKGLQCVVTSATNSNTICLVGNGGGPCSTDNDCSIYPTVNGAVAPTLCSNGSPMQMQCQNGVCLAVSGSPCINAATLPVNVNQCASGSTCTSTDGTCFNCS
jgi:hypothetical protein